MLSFLESPNRDIQQQNARDLRQVIKGIGIELPAGETHMQGRTSHTTSEHASSDGDKDEADTAVP